MNRFCLAVPYPLDTAVPNANYSHNIYIVLVITRNPEMVEHERVCFGSVRVTQGTPANLTAGSLGALGPQSPEAVYGHTAPPTAHSLSKEKPGVKSRGVADSARPKMRLRLC